MADITIAAPPPPVPAAAPAAPAPRRRRPSGEPPPLPRHLHTGGRWWAALTVGVVVVWFLVVVAGMGRSVMRFDDTCLRVVAWLRTPTATAVARRLQVLGSPEAVRVLRWTVLLGALAFRRFRQLVLFVGCVLVIAALTAGLSRVLGRARPLGVEVLGEWRGFSHPSGPVADVAVCLVGALYTMVPGGVWRSRAKLLVGAILGLLVAVRVYLAVDHPTDALFGLIIGVALTLIGFRLLAPADVFPVTYHRGRSAHLDLTGERGMAIKRALREQLGLDVAAVAPFGLDGSAGSTPVRITLADPSAPALFGKLYAATHLRADRWYKLGRTLRYGRLEDESKFSTVRRLVQYEDYLLRVMRDAGISTARPYGFVEITPEREYLIVTEFFEGSREITDAVVGEAVIDDALAVVRRLWDGGLAHRDIKPANILVRDSRVLLIDVAFAEVRPSPWRQAVDLANMMLVLGLRSDPATVYQRARRVFSEDEIAEAFAATRGLTLTSQLRVHLRRDGRDLIGAFRRLGPPRQPIRIQRWSVRRAGLTVVVAFSVLMAVWLTYSVFAMASLL